MTLRPRYRTTTIDVEKVNAAMGKNGPPPTDPAKRPQPDPYGSYAKRAPVANDALRKLMQSVPDAAWPAVEAELEKERVKQVFARANAAIEAVNRRLAPDATLVQPAPTPLSATLSRFQSPGGIQPPSIPPEALKRPSVVCRWCWISNPGHAIYCRDCGSVLFPADISAPPK